MAPSKLDYGIILLGPTLNAPHTLTPVSSYSKLLSKLMPSHLTYEVLKGLEAT